MTDVTGLPGDAAAGACEADGASADAPARPRVRRAQLVAPLVLTMIPLSELLKRLLHVVL
jgi:hypothetical protein